MKFNLCAHIDKWKKVIVNNRFFGGTKPKVNVLTEKERSRELVVKVFGDVLKNDQFKLTIIQKDEDFVLNEIEVGLISGFVNWSGYTIQIGLQVLEEIVAMGKKNIPLYIIDCDAISIETQEKLFGISNWGYFESCWVEKGIILKRYNRRDKLTPFVQFIKERLSMEEVQSKLNKKDLIIK